MDRSDHPAGRHRARRSICCWERPQPEPAVLRGYVGGEKIGLLEDEAVQDILDRNYRLTLDYARQVPWTW